MSGAGGARDEVKRRRAKKMNWSGQGPALASGGMYNGRRPVFVAYPRQAVAAVASYMCRGALWGARVTLKLYSAKRC